MINRIARLREEDGATAVLFALVLPVLLAMLGFGSEVLVMTAAERELQRTADQGALAAAAQIPLADLGALGGATSSSEILAALTPSATDPAFDACAVADGNAGSSALLTGFAETVPTCANGLIKVDPVALASPLLSEVGLMLTDLPTGPIAGIADGTLTGVLDAMESIGLPIEVLGLAPALTTPRVRVTASADVGTPLRTLVSDGGATPVSAAGTATRRFKNILLLPVLDTPGCRPATLSLSTGPTVDLLRGIVGDDGTIAFLHANDLLDLVQLEGLLNAVLPTTVIEAIVGPLALPDPLIPDTASIDQILATIGLDGIVDAVGADAVLDTLDPSASLDLTEDGSVVVGAGTDPVVTNELNVLLAATGLLHGLQPGCQVNLNTLAVGPAVTALHDVLDHLVAVLDALSVVVPGVDHLANLIELLATDLRDLLDPGTDAPSAIEVIEAAASGGEDVLVVTIGSTQIPALDFALTPAQDVWNLVDGAGNLDVAATMTGAGNVLSSTTTARGLFRATLVD